MKVVACFFLSLILGDILSEFSRTTLSRSLYPRAVRTLFRQLEKLPGPVSFSLRMPLESEESAMMLGEMAMLCLSCIPRRRS